MLLVVITPDPQFTANIGGCDVTTRGRKLRTRDGGHVSSIDKGLLGGFAIAATADLVV
jgi:hypothetical protein